MFARVCFKDGGFQDFTDYDGYVMGERGELNLLKKETLELTMTVAPGLWFVVELVEEE